MTCYDTPSRQGPGAMSWLGSHLDTATFVLTFKLQTLDTSSILPRIMDIFGTITSAIDLIKQICDYLRAVKDADGDRLILFAETSALGDLLYILRKRVSDPADVSGKPAFIQIGIQTALNQCCSALQLIDGKLNPGSGRFDRLMNKLEWPFRRDEIKETLGKIERLKSLISLSLQMSLKEFMEETRADLVAVGENVTAIEDKLSKLEELQGVHMKAIHLDLRNLVQDSATDIKTDLIRLEEHQKDHIRQTKSLGDGISVFASFMDEKKSREIVDWLSLLDFDYKQSNIMSTCNPATGNWFLDTPIFQSWMHGEFSTLWCPGMPGVGKTVITSFIINHLQEKFESSETAAVTFLFLEYTEKWTVLQLLGALFKQLARRFTMTPESLKMLEDHRRKNTRPKSEQLLALLKAEINRDMHRTVFILVDALDEISEDTRHELLAYLRTLPRNIRLLATSRDLPDIRDNFKDDKCFEINSDKKSMRLFIEDRISHNSNLRGLLNDDKHGLREDLISKIVEKADGMFLLARLHMESLEARFTRNQLRETLDQLPKELDATYDEALRRISPFDRELVYRIFSWVLRVKRPLTLADLQYALAVEEGEEMTKLNDDDLPPPSILSRCAGLIVLQHVAQQFDDPTDDNTKPSTQNRYNTQVIGFVHYTTQEYFLKNYDVNSKLPSPAHLAVTCLRYLHFDIFNQPIISLDDREKMWDIPFMDYTAIHWGDHVRDHLNDANVHDLLTRFFRDNQRVEVAGLLKVNATNCTALHLCSMFGLKDNLVTLLSEGADVNAKDSDGDTALTNAAIYGHDPIIEFLLARDDTDVNPRGWNGMTTLSRAVLNGHESIVRILLEKSGIDVNSKDVDGRTSLALAAEYGHERIVKLLLKKEGVNIESKDTNGYSPLALAVVYGNEGVVKLFLEEQSIDTHSRDANGRTPLALAVEYGYKNVVKLILEKRDVDIHSKDVNGRTPLDLAAEFGYEGVVKLLLEKQRVDSDSRYTSGHTPLAFAAAYGREEVVELLLGKNGVDVESKNANGSTPLALAAESGHEGVVKLLLEKQGVDVNSKDTDGSTPLALAAESGHEEVVKLLLVRQDVDFGLKNANGSTPLALAAESGQEGVVKLLLENQHIDIDSTDVKGSTPLALAAQYGHEAVMRMLLEKNSVNMDSKNLLGLTPLALAARCAQAEAVSLLLLEGADVNATNNNGDTPLALAAELGHEDVVNLLLARTGVEVDSHNIHGNTPLLLAAGSGHKAVVELLMNKDGVDISAKNVLGDTLLARAATNGHDDLVKFLTTKEGVDFKSKNVEGRNKTPIHDAIPPIPRYSQISETVTQETRQTRANTPEDSH